MPIRLYGELSGNFLHNLHIDGFYSIKYAQIFGDLHSHGICKIFKNVTIEKTLIIASCQNLQDKIVIVDSRIQDLIIEDQTIKLVLINTIIKGSISRK